MGWRFALLLQHVAIAIWGHYLGLELLSRKKGPCAEIYSIVTLKSLWTCGHLSNNEYIKLLYGSIWLCDAICIIIVKSLTPSTCHSWVALLAACPVMRLLRMKWPAWSYHPISRCSICGRKKRNGIPTPLTYCDFFGRPMETLQNATCIFRAVFVGWVNCNLKTVR